MEKRAKKQSEKIRKSDYKEALSIFKLALRDQRRHARWAKTRNKSILGYTRKELLSE